MLSYIRTSVYLFLFSIILLILVFSPYIYGYLFAPDGYKFMGLAHIPEDGCVYLNLIKQAKDGNNLFFNRFTSEKHFPLYFNLFFFCMGRLAQYFEWSALYALYAAKVASVFIFVFFFYYLFKYIFKSESWAWYGLMLLSFGGGFGWLAMVFPNFPNLFASNYMSEGNVFFSLLTYPHFVYSVILLTLSLYLFYLGWQKKNMFFCLLGGVFSLVLGMIHIYNFVIIWGVIFLFSIIALSFSRSNLFYVISNIVIVFIFTVPWAFINYYIVKKYYVYSRWYESYLHSPPPMDYLLSLGLIIIPLFIGILLLKDDENKQKTFMFIWVAAQSVVMYFPFPFQRKLFEGLQVPITILAVFVIIYISNNYFSKKGRIKFLMIFLILSSVNSFWLPINMIKDLRHSKDFYLSNEDWLAFKWIKNHIWEDDVILSSSATAKYIPAILEKPVYVGHWSQTIDLNDKLNKSSRFYMSMDTNEEALDFLREAGIKTVYFGLKEKEVFKVNELKYVFLDKMYDIGDVQIFDVQPDPEKWPTENITPNINNQ